MSSSIIIVLSCMLICGVTYAVKLDEVYAWKQIDFLWPSAQARDKAINSKQFIPENNLPLGLERWNDKIFVTCPRWKNGVASTLNYIPLNPTNISPVLIPYPSWKANTITTDDEHKQLELHTKPYPSDNTQTPSDKAAANTAAINDDEQLVSVFRIRVDACDRLWALDSGLIDSLGDAKQSRPPSLVVFNLKTDKLIRRYYLKPTDIKEDSFFANLAVDVTANSCDDAFVYLPDLGGYGVVVYSWKENTSWRVEHNFFHFDPLAGDFNVGGFNFQWTDGVFGLALSKIQSDGYRTMFFHALSSTKEFAVSTAILRNQTLATDSHTYYEYRLLGERGMYTQASISSLDEDSGVLFMTQINRNGIACWNPSKPLSAETLGLVAQDDKALIFPNDLIIDQEKQLWALSNRLPVFIYKGLDPNDVNFRIMKTKISDAIANTPCA